MRHRDFARDEAPAGSREKAANQRGAAVGEAPHTRAQAGLVRGREPAPERCQMPVALRRHRAEHRQHQPQMLDHDRSVLDTPA
jgi:hypothetical protein